MSEQLYINTDNNLPHGEDYYFMRSEGIKLIEKLSGKIWTDYNTHDPGITLLEALCYTLTDLGYRSSFEIKDILAPDPAGDEDAEQIFYTATEILPSNPITINDYRKLIIDTEGVKNAWVQKSDSYEVPIYVMATYNEEKEKENYKLTYDTTDSGPLNLKGLYKVTVEFEDEINTPEKERQIIDRIREKLNNHRNICEDILSIRKAEIELFKIEAEILVEEQADIKKINAQIFQSINNFFTPTIRFYTLDQMITKGYSSEDIFDGPVLKHGFIDTDELLHSERYMNVHLSDIIRLISDIDEVIAVKKIIFPIETPSAFSDFSSWINEVKTRKMIPKLDIENSAITFIRNGSRSKEGQIPDKAEVKVIYFFLQSEKKTTKLKGINHNIQVPKGEYMDLADYFPFQHILPACYGMEQQIVKTAVGDTLIESAVNELNSGKNTPHKISEHVNLLQALATELFGKSLASLETDHEKHQIKSHFRKHQLEKLSDQERQILQLRGFLMVFEQILSDYLSQLGNIKKVFSFDPAISQTYFPQALKEINDIEMLFIHSYERKDFLLSLIENENVFIKRRDAILNHLLARFGEDLDQYGNEIKRDQKNQNKINISNKATFLKEYIKLSNYRGNGFNYRNTDQIWNTDNVIGAKKRICRLLGIKDYHTRYSTANNIEIEKVLYENKLERFVVVVKHTESRNVLLKSIEYKDQGELGDILNHLLQNGSNKENYIREARHNKHTYALKSWGQEDQFETVATHSVDSKEESEFNFNALIETLESFAQNENFHIVEHILLRPKIDPQGKIKAKKADQISSTDIDLLHIPPIISTKPFKTKPLSDIETIDFKFKSIKVNDKAWRLSLEKDNIEILYASEYLNTESHLDNRIAHIRQAATDKANYEIEEEKGNLYLFKIKDNEQVLAISTMRYQNEEDIKADIDELLKFFSYDKHQVTEQPENENADYMDHADPYSFQISIIVPNWPARFKEPGFKHFFEKAIYMEIPAHVYVHIHWLDYQGMLKFENTYKPWLEAIAEDEIPDPGLVNNLISTLNHLNKHD